MSSIFSWHHDFAKRFICAYCNIRQSMTDKNISLLSWRNYVSANSAFVHSYIDFGMKWPPFCKRYFKTYFQISPMPSSVTHIYALYVLLCGTPYRYGLGDGFSRVTTWGSQLEGIWMGHSTYACNRWVIILDSVLLSCRHWCLVGLSAFVSTMVCTTSATLMPQQLRRECTFDWDNGWYILQRKEKALSDY